uniref:NB-ARC domain-containing protein n=1 Tax=Oryza glaberrima TaxID=4538 RepID=I1QZP7_ORYGL
MDVVGAASWLVQVVLEKLVGDGIDAAWAAARAGGDPGRAHGGDVRRLGSRLQSLHALLSEAQEHAPMARRRSEALLRSLRSLQSLATDADNLLDEMLYHQIHRRLHPDEPSTSSNSCSSLFAVQLVEPNNRVAKRVRHSGDGDTTGRIKDILERMCEAGDDVREAIKMEKLDVSAAGGGQDDRIIQRRPTTSYSTEPKVFGRDTVKDRIVVMLISSETCGADLAVLPIVGNGGVGKTTLAQLVYSDTRVQAQFSKRIWISVSVDFDEVRLTRELLDCVSNGVNKHGGITNLNKLQEILEEDLKSERLLLVLDDMWEDNDKSRWNKLLAPLRCSSLRGNAILVTTRNHSVVKMIATMDPIHLDGLEDGDFWLLFKACAFGDEKYEGHPSLQVIGKCIANKLKGYPLAAKSVGALLNRDLDGGHWMSILQSDEWKLQRGPDDIIPALMLSYIHLPFHLQRCFSYCALFPKGHRFDGLDLVRVWISQGFVSSNNKKMEDIGHQYLNDLVDCGFFQRSTYYSMHDLIHDLAHIVSADECHMIDGFNSSGIAQSTIQHLSINTRYAYKWDVYSQKFYSKDDFKRKLTYVGETVQTRNLSTLMLFGKYDADFSETFSHIFKEVQYLRVLRLPTLTYSIDYLLSNFSKLIHLRYLELISSGPGGPLPEVICQLYHLQVLDVEYWVHLSTLPRAMNDLVNLRHFVARGELHALIAGVGRLKFLQELKEFRVGKTTDFQIGQLNGLRELGGSLAIYNLENICSKEESKNAGLRDKIYLKDLLLSWCSNRFEVSSVIEEEVLESLQPHSGLKCLSINGYGGISCPTWLSSINPLISLETICLDSCTKWEVLPPLGQFPLLRTLHLIQLPSSRVVPTVSSDDWTGSEKHIIFPCLEELVIRDCPELRTLGLSPCSFETEGSHTFGRLHHATIYNCPQLMNLPQFGQTKYLSTISIEGVGSFPYIRLFVRALYIKGCTSPSKLDQILMLIEGNLCLLEKLTIESCLDLTYLPWKTLSKLVSLEMLVIVDCPRLSLTLYPYNQDGGNFSFMSLLNKLVIRACSITGKQLSHLILQLPFLHYLTIGKCPKITSLLLGDVINGSDSSSTSDYLQLTTDGMLQIPSHLLIQLQYLSIDDFPDLVLLWKEGFHGFTSLWTLHITGCTQLLSPMITENKRSNKNSSLLPPLLHDLMVTHVHNELLPFLLSNLTSLSIFAISNSPELSSLVLHSCTSLETLIIEKCVGLSALEGLHSLPKLKHLRIFQCPSLAKTWGPSSVDRPGFSLYLDKLEIDTTVLFNTEVCKKLPSLRHLVFFMLSIKACPGIKSLPENGLPASLHELYVSSCSAELKEQCKKTKNVRCVYVDRNASKFIVICKLLRLYFRITKLGAWQRSLWLQPRTGGSNELMVLTKVLFTIATTVVFRTGLVISEL